MQMQETHVKELMERSVIKVSPDDSLGDVSKMMKETKCGCLPVGDGDKVEGIITDRDIIIRAVVEGPDLTHKKVRDYMTKTIQVCHEDDTVAAAVKKMRVHGISRLVVADGSGKTCGILSFGKILRNLTDDDEVTEVVACANGRILQPPESALTGNARHSY